MEDDGSNDQHENAEADLDKFPLAFVDHNARYFDALLDGKQKELLWWRFTATKKKSAGGKE